MANINITPKAPTDAKYIVQTADTTLSAEQALSSLSTGLMKVTTTTGAITTATAGTDYRAMAKRVVTTATDTTAVIDVGITDVYELTGMAGATTFTFTGTPTDGQMLLVRIKDDGNTRVLTWTGFTAIGVTLPTDSTAGKWHYVGCTYNLGATTWHVIAVSEQA